MSAGLVVVSVVAVGVIVIVVIRMVVDRGSHVCCCLLFDSCIQVKAGSRFKPYCYSFVVSLNSELFHLSFPLVRENQYLLQGFSTERSPSFSFLCYVEKEMPNVDEKPSSNLFFSPCGKTCESWYFSPAS